MERRIKIFQVGKCKQTLFQVMSLEAWALSKIYEKQTIPASAFPIGDWSVIGQPVCLLRRLGVFYQSSMHINIIHNYVEMCGVGK